MIRYATENDYELLKKHDKQNRINKYYKDKKNFNYVL